MEAIRKKGGQKITVWVFQGLSLSNAHWKNGKRPFIYQGRTIHNAVHWRAKCTGFGNFVVHSPIRFVDKAWNLQHQILKNVFIPECTPLIVIGIL